jgi:AraC-like DNA-binding protein
MPRSATRPSPARFEQPYTELAPPADLASHVDRFWWRTTLAGTGRYHRVLPDGCVDVIVHVERGSVELVGTMTRALELPEAPAELVAVRFKPGTAAALTRCALIELTDRQPDLVDVVGRAAGGGALLDRVSQAALPRDRVAILVDWLRLHLTGAPRPDPMIAHAITQLVAPTAPRVDQVADQLGVTRQHLARRFRREVGITPKQLARIARMQRAAAALARGTPDLARLAAELGYFDQSHLSYDLRELVGVTPAALAVEHPLALPHLFAAPGP